MKIISFEIIEKETGVISIYINTINHGREYKQRLVIYNKKISWWGCDCEFGSLWRFSKKYMEKDIKCKHIRSCVELLKYLGYIK